LHRTKKLEEGNRHKKQIADLLATDKEQLARVKVFPSHPPACPLVATALDWLLSSSLR
jgi:hypothetical protein